MCAAAGVPLLPALASLPAAQKFACSTRDCLQHLECACLQINPAAGAAIAQAFASATATAGASSPAPAQPPVSPVASPAPTVQPPTSPVATPPPATKAPVPPVATKAPPPPSPSPSPAPASATAAANATANARSAGEICSLLHNCSELPTAHQYRLGALLWHAATFMQAGSPTQRPYIVACRSPSPAEHVSSQLQPQREGGHQGAIL